MALLELAEWVEDRGKDFMTSTEVMWSTWGLNMRTRDLQSLRKHAHSNKLKILPPKPENFQIKNLVFFIFLLKT